MPRKYTKIKELEPEVFRMKEEGKTNREIAEHFGLTREQIIGLINRHNRNEQNVRYGNLPKTKGRPRKYVSHEFYRLTQSYNITPSMSRRGNPIECIYRQMIDTFTQAQGLIDNYIWFYNNERNQLKTKLAPLVTRHQFLA